jgi:hypothetical protein
MIKKGSNSTLTTLSCSSSVIKPHLCLARTPYSSNRTNVPVAGCLREKHECRRCLCYAVSLRATGVGPLQPELKTTILPAILVLIACHVVEQRLLGDVARSLARPASRSQRAAPTSVYAVWPTPDKHLRVPLAQRDLAHAPVVSPADMVFRLQVLRRSLWARDSLVGICPMHTS